MKSKMLAACAEVLDTEDLPGLGNLVDALRTRPVGSPEALRAVQGLSSNELAVVQALIDIRTFLSKGSRSSPVCELHTGLGETLSLKCKVTSKGAMTATVTSGYFPDLFSEATFRRILDPLMPDRGSAQAWSSDWAAALPRLFVDLVPFLTTQLDKEEESCR